MRVSRQFEQTLLNMYSKKLNEEQKCLSV